MRRRDWGEGKRAPRRMRVLALATYTARRRRYRPWSLAATTSPVCPPRPATCNTQVARLDYVPYIIIPRVPPPHAHSSPARSTACRHPGPGVRALAASSLVSVSCLVSSRAVVSAPPPPPILFWLSPSSRPGLTPDTLHGPAPARPLARTQHYSPRTHATYCSFLPLTLTLARSYAHGPHTTTAQCSLEPTHMLYSTRIHTDRQAQTQTSMDHRYRPLQATRIDIYLSGILMIARRGAWRDYIRIRKRSNNDMKNATPSREIYSFTLCVRA
ncbi:hypothetical protein VTO73DRAFT_7279 [Trametes versicolor]